MKQKKEREPVKAEEVLAQDVPYGLAIKQLIGLSVANLPEEVLEKSVTKVQKTFEQVAQSEKAYEDARMVGVDLESRTALLLEWQTSLREYRAACVCFADILLGQVFTWLEGGKNE